MTNTVINNIPYLPDATTDPAAGLNVSLDYIDALLQLSVVAIQNDPPGSSSTGDRYLVGTAGTGAWAGQDNKLATSQNDGASWLFQDAVVAVVQGAPDPGIYIKLAGTWSQV